MPTNLLSAAECKNAPPRTCFMQYHQVSLTRFHKRFAGFLLPKLDQTILD